MISGKSLNSLIIFLRRLTRNVFGKFTANQAGAVVLLFGLTLIPIMGFVGGAIDYAYAYRARAKLQNALDAAALAAGREMDLGSSESNAYDAALKVLEANLGSDFPPGVSFNLNIAGDVVTATANLDVETFILGTLGIDSFPVGAASSVNVSGGTFEVALVLDNSGSMSGSRISDLKTASENLTDILFGSETTSDRVAMSVVPFSASVNVGTQFATASWMDQTGQSSIHREHFDTNVTRWDMFAALNNVSWAGCVEARPNPLDVNDTPATGGDSMFVPLFAPDEPSFWWYRNSYISDTQGNCPQGTGGGTYQQRQARTCKYFGENASTSNVGATNRGPNHMCNSQAITALANTKSTIVSAINSMNARGYTNIHLGLMWGWRTLSPGEPFSQGKPYTEPDHSKVMILMTDGANTFPSSWSHNRSWYSSYGFHAQNRLGAASNSTTNLRNAMNAKTALSCTNAKASGIIIYTIAFSISDTNTVNMLRDCATNPSYALAINNGSALVSAFEAIAHSINKLRISS